ncbi:MAG: hypothetical protein ACM3OO_05150 [Planctomycetaceae bacterium]
MAAAAKPRRASRRQIRVWAWIAGTLSFFAPFAAFGLSPRPAASAAPVKTKPPHLRPPKRPVVIVVTKKIVIDAPSASAASSSTTTSGSAPVNYVYAPAPAAPAPAPVAVSCGTTPC